jgi:hypothetical protein
MFDVFYNGGVCDVGTKIEDNNPLCGTTRTWSCKGINGGAKASCSYSNVCRNIDIDLDPIL